MLFNSLTYAIFLPIVVALYWASPIKLRVPILLLASYIFYMSWRPVFILLILGLTVVNYLFGFYISRSEKNKKPWLFAAVATNLATLCFFKYAYFLNDSLTTLLKPAGMAPPAMAFDIILPLGISFFVFEFIHYVVDVYRGSQPIKSFMAFALFASFFPTQIAGPIKRFQDFIPQFLNPAKFSIKDFDSGFSLILLGLFKKVLLADNLAFFVQGGFQHPELFHSLDLWLFTYAFAFQIYFDFSGYTDIARGSAMLFGYKVPINFNLPYLAKNISEFWHRWHISLSTWLRDYLFIPLGGSRGSKWNVYRNLMITMGLGGLWHGAATHFLVWGVFHGAMLALHKMFKDSRTYLAAHGHGWLSAAIDSKVGTVLSTLFTFHVVCIGWVLFRADTLAVAGDIVKKLFFMDTVFGGMPAYANLMTLPSINYPLIYPAIFVLLPVLAVSHIVMGYVDKTNWVERSPRLVKAAWCCALMLMILVFSPDKSPKFIYFQF